MRQRAICPALTRSRAAPRDQGPPSHYVSTADVATDLLAPRPFLWSPQLIAQTRSLLGDLPRNAG